MRLFLTELCVGCAWFVLSCVLDAAVSEYVGVVVGGWQVP